MHFANPSRLTLEAFSEKSLHGEWADFSIDYDFVTIPLGRCLIGASAGRICYMAFAPEGRDREMLADLSSRWPGAVLLCNPQMLGGTADQVFAESGSYDGLIKLLVRGTQFQVEVWRALLGIPTGSVQTYAQVALKMGRPGARRAVGSAIGANPIAWLIPCHRVIRSDGQLGGYRWGIAMKKACLDFERKRLNNKRSTIEVN